MSLSVILPLHDALFSPRLIPLLIELGRRSDAVVHVVDLRPSPDAADAAPGRSPRDAGFGKNGRQHALREAYVESVAHQIADVLGSTRVKVAVREGEPGEQLAEYARERDAELIAIGTEDRDEDGHEAALSFARALARYTGVAVFLLASSRDETSGIFVADLDGSEAARSRLELALSSTRLAGARELTVYALPDGDTIAEPPRLHPVAGRP
ncbi:MAG TPA: universal stress protein [Longimicrobiaceae bacterium]